MSGSVVSRMCVWVGLFSCQGVVGRWFRGLEVQGVSIPVVDRDTPSIIRLSSLIRGFGTRDLGSDFNHVSVLTFPFVQDVFMEVWSVECLGMVQSKRLKIVQVR